jgi:hypothetical protein
MSGKRRLVITLNGEDISNDCTLEKGRSNPFGWSQYEIRYGEILIGFLESGTPMDMKDKYEAKIIEEEEL